MSCNWTEDIDDEGTYDTGCNNRFAINEGTPEDNGFIFCPYCGELIAADAAGDE